MQGAASGGLGLWQARCAVLALLANYLHQSPAMQLKSVRDWDMVAALFELLWEEKARRIALRLVGPLRIRSGQALWTLSLPCLGWPV